MRFHFKAHKKLLAGVPRHSAATQSGSQRHQAAAVESPSTPATPMVGHVAHGLCPGPHGGRGEGSRPRAEPPPIPPNANGRHVLERMHPRAATRQGPRPKHWSRLWCDAVSPSTWKSPHGVASGPSTLGSHQEASLPPNFQHPDSRRSRSPLPAPHSRIPRDLKPLPAGGRDSEGTNNLSSQPRRCLQARDSTITAEAPPPPLQMPAPPNLLPCCLSA